MTERATNSEARRSARSGHPGEIYVLPITDVAAYVADMVEGIRSITSAGRGEEMRFLDGLLGMAVAHAKSLARGEAQPRAEALRPRQRTRKSSRRVVAASEADPSSSASRTSGSMMGSSAE